MVGSIGSRCRDSPCRRSSGCGFRISATAGRSAKRRRCIRRVCSAPTMADAAGLRCPGGPLPTGSRAILPTAARAGWLAATERPPRSENPAWNPPIARNSAVGLFAACDSFPPCDLRPLPPLIPGQRAFSLAGSSGTAAWSCGPSMVDDPGKSRRGDCPKVCTTNSTTAPWRCGVTAAGSPERPALGSCGPPTAACTGRPMRRGKACRFAD